MDDLIPSDDLNAYMPMMLFIIWLCICYFLIKSYTGSTTHYTIRYHPVKVMYKHHIIRIPLEDRIDLAIDDRHNVHNKCLKRNATQVIEQLKKSDQHQYSIETAFEQIYRLIELSPDPNLDRLDAAIYVLQSIEDIDAFYHVVNLSEKEIIRLVWERINHPINQTHIELLKNNLIEQLADCRNDYSGVQCCEGRIMRILQTLEQSDTEEFVNLRPMWAYREEIGNKISQYRQKLLDNVPEKYQQLESKTELTEEDRRLLNQFNTCLINNLTKRFVIDYVSKGLLSKDDLKDLTQDYYKSLYEY
jgi:hypothetical protein